MKIAIFDFDNTLSEGYARYEHGYAMEAAGLVKKGLRDEVSALQTSYEDGQMGYNDKFAKDKEIFAKYYKGLNRIEIERFLREDFDLEKHYFPWGKELIAKLKDAGYLTVIISGCWDFILEEAQEHLQYDTFFGTSFEVEGGVLTGGFTRIIDHKMKESYSTQLLSGAKHSIGLGDSAADLPFLKIVKDGFLYEPNRDAVELGTQYNLKIVNSSNVLDEVLKTF